MKTTRALLELLSAVFVYLACCSDAFAIIQRRPLVSSSLSRTTNTATTASSDDLSAAAATPDSSSSMKDSYDVVVVGSGIGGLCSAAMLALYGYSVAVYESHTAAGGAAHGFSVFDRQCGGRFHFDTGPSFFAGINPDAAPKASNPLRTVLDAIDEKVECIPYKTFGLKFPEGDFIHTSDFGAESGVLGEIPGQEQVMRQWKNLMQKMRPLENAVNALPTAALRGDIGVALTAAPFLPNFITKTNPIDNLKLTRPFSTIVQDAGVDSAGFIRNWLDLLCFCLSGLPTDGTITAEMAMMMGEFYDSEATMDCPRNGAKAIVDALVRGLKKNGGSLFVNSHIDRIDIVDGKAVGVTLKRNNRKIKAKKAVISNLSVWDLFKSGIVDTKEFPECFVKQRLATPVGKSFMHMHVGFQMSREQLDKLQAHYMYIDDWSRGVEAEDNAVLLSIPSVHDHTLAPDGYGVLHIYTPATEDYERWRGLDRKSDEYERLKDARSRYLWEVLEKIIPDIRGRARVVKVGTPLTHERFLRRYKGSYGAAIRADEGSFPFPGTPIKGLLVCGDSCFPGIGVPAVAGSGLLAANSISLESLKPQREVLNRLNLLQTMN